MSFRRLLGCLASVALATATLGMVTTSGASAALDAHLTRYPYLTDLVGTNVTVNWATDRAMGASGSGWVRLGTPGAGGACTFGGFADTQGTKKSLAIGPSDQLPSPPAPATGTPEYQWTATVTLPAAGTYCYTVFASGGSAPSATFPTTDLLAGGPYPKFTTQVPAGSTQPYSFAVFGDWGQVDQTGQNPYLKSIMSEVAGSGVNFAVTVGDNAYNSGAQDEYGDLQQSTGTAPDPLNPGSTKPVGLSAVFGPSFWTVPAQAGIPIFPAIGNHGLMRSDSTCAPGLVQGTPAAIAQCHPHLMNWPQPTAVSTSGGSYTATNYGPTTYGTTPVTLPDTWYAFDAGNARFYVLETAWPDTNWGSLAGTSTGGYANDYEAHWKPGAAEVEWLKQDLAAHPGGLKFAFFHKPLTSDTASAREATDTYLRSDGPTPNAATDSLEAILANNGVNIAFTGHAHIYERNAPHTGGPSLVNYVTGGGGAQPESLTGLGACDANDMYAIAWSPSKAALGQPAGSACGTAPKPTDQGQVFHFLKVTVNGTQVTVTPTSADGSTFDVQTYNFGPPTAASGSGYLLDGWGGLHAYATGGQAPLPPAVGAAYWRNFNIARDVALVHDKNGNATGGYMLDGWGGLHTFKVGANGTVPPAATKFAYWQGFDIARSITVVQDPNTAQVTGGYVLDGWGGVHQFTVGNNPAPPAPTTFPYWPGADIARDMALLPNGGAYVLDAWGPLHRVTIGGVTPPPALNTTSWIGRDVARGLVVTPDGMAGYVTDGTGASYPFQVTPNVIVPPVTTHPVWDWDIGRGVGF